MSPNTPPAYLQDDDLRVGYRNLKHSLSLHSADQVAVAMDKEQPRLEEGAQMATYESKLIGNVGLTSCI